MGNCMQGASGQQTKLLTKLGVDSSKQNCQTNTDLEMIFESHMQVPASQVSRNIPCMRHPPGTERRNAMICCLGFLGKDGRQHEDSKGWAT